MTTEARNVYTVFVHCDTKRTLTREQEGTETVTVLDINANRALRIALAYLSADMLHDRLSADDWRTTRFQIMQAFFYANEYKP